MKVAAILVDLDGTLADTSGANYRAYAQAMAEVGVVVAREEFEARAAGRHWTQFLPGFLAGAGCTVDARGVAQRKACLYADCLREVVPNEALVALLRLRAASTKTALVTSASRANASAVLTHLGLADLFDTIVTGDDVARHKPEPDGYELAARRLQVEPAQCIVIEDSDAGVASAMRFGAQVLRVRLVPAAALAAA